jgi:hypothetical protein
MKEEIAKLFQDLYKYNRVLKEIGYGKKEYVIKDATLEIKIEDLSEAVMKYIDAVEIIKGE